MRSLPIPLLVLLSACLGRAPAPPPSPPPAPPPPPPPPPEVVWTARPEVAIRGDSIAVAVASAFTRLDVSGRDSLGLRVTCDLCPGGAAGVVSEADVIAEAKPIEEAAAGSIAEFALAVRQAAAWGKVDSLAAVMVDDFSFGLAAQRDRAAALTAWDWENYRTLDQLPRLLDEGLVEIGPDFWVAPPAYAAAPGFQGLRAGFKRNPETGRWEWLFLVAGD